MESWQEQLARTDALIFVAEDAGRTCGFVCGGKLREPIGDYDAELYAIYLLLEYQNHGLGRSLMQHLAKRLAQSDFQRLAVWVLAENPACGFYARLGAARIAEKPIEIGVAHLIEVAYGWRDIEQLVSLRGSTPQ